MSPFSSARLACVMLLIALCSPPLLHAGPQEDAAETARLLAILLDTGRVTVAKNQDLINDAAKGAKGFPASLFEQQLTDD